MPASMEPFARQFKRIHAEHTVRALPDTSFRRLHAIAMNQWEGRESLGLTAIVGALDFDAAGVFALVSALLLFSGYLGFAHSPAWSPYTSSHGALGRDGLGLCGGLGRCAARVPRGEVGRRCSGGLIGPQ